MIETNSTKLINSICLFIYFSIIIFYRFTPSLSCLRLGNVQSSSSSFMSCQFHVHILDLRWWILILMLSFLLSQGCLNHVYFWWLRWHAKAKRRNISLIIASVSFEQRACRRVLCRCVLWVLSWLWDADSWVWIYRRSLNWFIFFENQPCRDQELP